VISKLRAPDKNIERAVQDIYAKINELIAAVNTGSTQTKIKDSEGKASDIRLSKKAKNDYELFVRTDEGWQKLGTGGETTATASTGQAGVTSEDVIGEVVSGADAVETVFESEEPYQTDSLAIYVNGIRQKVSDDYVEVTKTSFAFTNAPKDDDLIVIDYKKEV